MQLYLKKKMVAIPHCVLDVCSCKHQNTLPKVSVVGTISNNHTIHLRWCIKTDNETFHNIPLKRIAIIINEQTNPSLSWGGKNLPLLKKVYELSSIASPSLSPLSVSAVPLSSNQEQEDTFELKIDRDLKPGTVLNIHSNVIDELQCVGPSSVIKLKVPLKESIPLQNINMETKIAFDDNIRLALIIATIIFVTVTVSTLTYCLWLKNKLNQRHGLHGNCDLVAAEIQMENNVNYVPYTEFPEVQRNNNFEISASNIHIEAVIGEGAFGRVYRAVATNLRQARGSKVVAVKQLKKNSRPDEEDEFLKEIKMLQDVGTHKNIVRFLGCGTLRRPYFMVMEFVGRGDLLSYLRTVRYKSKKFKQHNADCSSYSNLTEQTVQDENKLKYLELKMSSTQSIESESGTSHRIPKPSLAETTYTIVNHDDGDLDMNEFEYKLDDQELYDFALQIANGMRFLERQKVTHRDLAARNVLIDDRKTLKISDFGLSRHDVYVNTKTRKLPLRWLSIEAILDNTYTSKSDVWSYGVVLWEIGTLGASPYPTISNNELVKFLTSGGRLDKPDICTNQIYKLMLECWTDNPNERPSFEEIYKMLSTESTYIDISTLSDDYVFPPIKDNV